MHETPDQINFSCIELGPTDHIIDHDVDYVGNDDENSSNTYSLTIKYIEIPFLKKTILMKWSTCTRIIHSWKCESCYLLEKSLAPTTKESINKAVAAPQTKTYYKMTNSGLLVTLVIACHLPLPMYFWSTVTKLSTYEMWFHSTQSYMSN